MSELIQTILGSTIVTTAITSVMAYYIHKKTERVTAQVKREFERLAQAQSSDFEWRRQVTELLGQVYIHLNRSRLAFEHTYSRLQAYDAVFEDEVMYTSNKQIRDTLLANGNHLPPELLDQASMLIEHYDAWLVKYAQLRKQQKDTGTIQIYVGPDGYPFPDRAEELFKAKYQEMFLQLRLPAG